MSHHRRSVAVMATVAALAAVPATASAKSHDSVASAAASVQVHVNKAETAVKRLKRAVAAHKGTTVKKELKTARSQTAAAARGARSMAYSASSDVQEVAATQSLALAGTQYDALITAITDLVDEISGQAQALIAQAISPSLAGKANIITMLTTMLAKVPAEVQPVVASIIAALSLGDTAEVTNLDQAANSGTLPDNISSMVTSCLNMAMDAVNSAFSMIQGFLPMFPAAVQGPLGTILSTVTSTVGTLVPSILGPITSLIDSVLSSLPFVGGTSATGGIGNLGGLLSGLLGGGSGATAGIGNIGNTITDLLGGLFGGGAAPAAGGSTSPLAGIGGIIGSVTGLINGLLGGLLGGLVPAT
jgi:phage-related protein